MKAQEFLNITREPYPTLRVQVSRDALPNGLALAMAPVVTDWERSSLGGDDGDFYLVRGVNFGGNPVQGQSILTTVKVPCRGVVAAEWVMSLVRVKGRDTPGGHGQLRLIFAEDGPQKVNLLHEEVEKVFFLWAWNRVDNDYVLFFSWAQELLIHQFIHNDLGRRTDDLLSAGWIKGVGLPGPDQLPIGRIVQVGLQ